MAENPGINIIDGAWITVVPPGELIQSMTDLTSVDGEQNRADLLYRAIIMVERGTIHFWTSDWPEAPVSQSSLIVIDETMELKSFDFRPGVNIPLDAKIHMLNPASQGSESEPVGESAAVSLTLHVRPVP